MKLSFSFLSNKVFEMKSDFGKTISSAIKYSAVPKRMLPFFILLLPYIAALILFLDNAGVIIQAFLTRNIGSIASLLGFALGFVILAVIIGLMTLWLNTLVVENSKRYWQGSTKRLLSEERKAVKGTFLNAFIGTVAVAVISMIVSMIPFVGWLLGIIIGLMFFAYLPASVLNRTNGLKESYEIFMENKLETFAFWIVLAVISLVFIAIALIPALIALMAAAGGALFTALAAGSGFTGVFAAIKSHLVIVAIGGIISAFLFSFVTLFDTSAKTMYYLQMAGKKKRS
ncbi:MAG: hypothetical protein HY513_00310 [Candidatus Aenigmarchaeota archaeon]|nr:hypothetical protein [Candidatus Aenigmarchaeota archaeon]